VNILHFNQSKHLYYLFLAPPYPFPLTCTVQQLSLHVSMTSSYPDVMYFLLDVMYYAIIIIIHCLSFPFPLPLAFSGIGCNILLSSLILLTWVFSLSLLVSLPKEFVNLAYPFKEIISCSSILHILLVSYFINFHSNLYHFFPFTNFRLYCSYFSKILRYIISLFAVIS
jgi:hypothetical protein